MGFNGPQQENQEFICRVQTAATWFQQLVGGRWAREEASPVTRRAGPSPDGAQLYVHYTFYCWLLMRMVGAFTNIGISCGKWCHHPAIYCCRAGKDARRPVSRVLSRAEARAMAIHLGRPSPDASRDRPGRQVRKPTRRRSWNRRAPPLLGLAPGGVCPAAPVAGGAVRSYRTLSPLLAGLAARGERSPLCGTFPGVAPAGRYPAPCLRGARTFLRRALTRRRRPSGRLAPSDYARPPARSSTCRVCLPGDESA